MYQCSCTSGSGTDSKELVGDDGDDGDDGVDGDSKKANLEKHLQTASETDKFFDANYAVWHRFDDAPTEINKMQKLMSKRLTRALVVGEEEHVQERFEQLRNLGTHCSMMLMLLVSIIFSLFIKYISRRMSP